MPTSPNLVGQVRILVWSALPWLASHATACESAPGIKKQACINRKCLLMVPRDEDGEKLARKRVRIPARTATAPPHRHIHLFSRPHMPTRIPLLGATCKSPSVRASLLQAKQRAVPPTPDSVDVTMGETHGDRREELSPATVRPAPAKQPSSKQPSAAASAAAAVEPAPAPTSSSSNKTALLRSTSPASLLGGTAARAQALSEQCLYRLALQDDETCAAGAAGDEQSCHRRSLQSAMLAAAIRTPEASRAPSPSPSPSPYRSVDSPSDVSTPLFSSLTLSFANSPPRHTAFSASSSHHMAVDSMFATKPQQPAAATTLALAQPPPQSGATAAGPEPAVSRPRPIFRFGGDNRDGSSTGFAFSGLKDSRPTLSPATVPPSAAAADAKATQARGGAHGDSSAAAAAAATRAPAAAAANSSAGARAPAAAAAESAAESQSAAALSAHLGHISTKLDPVEPLKPPFRIDELQEEFLVKTRRADAHR